MFKLLQLISFPTISHGDWQLKMPHLNFIYSGNAHATFSWPTTADACLSLINVPFLGCSSGYHIQTHRFVKVPVWDWRQTSITVYCRIALVEQHTRSIFGACFSSKSAEKTRLWVHSCTYTQHERVRIAICDDGVYSATYHSRQYSWRII